LQRVLTEAAQAKQRGVVAKNTEGRALPQALGVEDAFPRWIMQRSSTAMARADWLAERVSQWPLVPKLALGMILPGGGAGHLALTLRSLSSQTIGNWVLHIVAEAAAPVALDTEPRICWHVASAGAATRPADELSRRLAASDAHFVALIDAGDQLAPHALFGVADAFFRHPEWRALYTDEARIDPQG
jgi:O-antigen biosynthesis protein